MNLVKTKRTDLARGNDVLIFGVLIDSEAQDIICVLEVKTLRACWRSRENGTWVISKIYNANNAILLTVIPQSNFLLCLL